MTDLLVTDIDPDLSRRLQERAQRHHHSLSDEAKALLRKGLLDSEQHRRLGSEMFDSILPEDRGDDLVFEYRGNSSEPPKFE